MGRSYWFECSKCGYRARVSGRNDRGVQLQVQTVACRDCKELYDAVVRMKVPDGLPLKQQLGGLLRQPSLLKNSQRPPTFQSALNRLNTLGLGPLKWVQFKPQCPVSAAHRVQTWNEPDRCPRCGVLLERHALPYRIWD